MIELTIKCDSIHPDDDFSIELELIAKQLAEGSICGADRNDENSYSYKLNKTTE